MVRGEGKRLSLKDFWKTRGSADGLWHGDKASIWFPECYFLTWRLVYILSLSKRRMAVLLKKMCLMLIKQFPPYSSVFGNRDLGENKYIWK